MNVDLLVVSSIHSVQFPSHDVLRLPFLLSRPHRIYIRPIATDVARYVIMPVDELVCVLDAPLNHANTDEPITTLSQGNVHSPSRQPSFSLKATFTLSQGDLHSLSRQRSLSLKATFILYQGNVHSPSRRPSFSLKATFTLPQGDPHSLSRQRSLSLKATFILFQGNVHSPSRRPSFSLKATFILTQGDPQSGHRSRLNSHRLTRQLTASSRCVCRWV